MGQSLVESSVGAATATAFVINSEIGSSGSGKENTRTTQAPKSIADLELIKTIGKNKKWKTLYDCCFN